MGGGILDRVDSPRVERLIIVYRTNMVNRLLRLTGIVIPVTLFAFVMLSNAALADPWTDGGSSVYVTDTSDSAGIGTTSPGTKLHVTYDANSVWGFRLNNTYSGGRSWTLGDGISAHGGFSIYDSTAAADRLFIASTGKIGLGTVSPSRLLHISNSASDTGIRIESTGTTADFLLYSGVGGADKFGIYDEDAGTDRLVIDSSGNIGIGTTSPGQKLDVNGDVAINETLYGPAGSALTLEAQSGRAMIFNTDGANERMRVANDGDVIVKGQLGVQDATPNIDLAVGDNDTGVEQVSDGILTLITNNAEALRANTNQDIRIGSSTGTGRLYVEKNDSWAIYGLSSAGSDSYGGIYGEVNNTGNYNSTGVYGVTKGHGNIDGQPLGVRGDARYTGSPAGGQFGVLGYNYSQGNGTNVDSAGVWGGSVGTPGSEGEFATYGNGVQGETYSKNNTSGGGIFYSLSDDGDADGVVGATDSSSGNSFGVYSSGKFGASGTKSAVVYTESQGPTQLYAEEATEVWFADYGEGKLTDGSTKIDLDPLFLETVTINEEDPIQVFTQSYSNAILYVTRGTDSFEVHSISGESDASFGYRVLAKRKYYDNERMQSTKATIDRFMRPDLDEPGLVELNERWGIDYLTTEELLPDVPPFSETTRIEN